MGSPLHQAALSFFKALSRPLFSDRLCPHYNLSIEQDRTYLEHLIQTHQELQLGSVEEITDTLVSASPSIILYWEKIALFIHTSHLNACVYNYIYIFRHVPLYVYISSGAHATFWTLSFGSSVDWPVHRDVAITVSAVIADLKRAMPQPPLLKPIPFTVWRMNTSFLARFSQSLCIYLDVHIEIILPTNYEYNYILLPPHKKMWYLCLYLLHAYIIYCGSGVTCTS